MAVGKTELTKILLAAGNAVVPASGTLAEFGIDALCKTDINGIFGLLSLEYRIDPDADRTGELTLITQVREPDGSITPGWLRRSVANCIVFFLPVSKHMMFVDTMWLKDVIFSGAAKDSIRDTGWLPRGERAGRGVYFPAAALVEWRAMLSSIHGMKR